MDHVEKLLEDVEVFVLETGISEYVLCEAAVGNRSAMSQIKKDQHYIGARGVLKLYSFMEGYRFCVTGAKS